MSRLKGVNKVRVSLPEDRKTAQALMRQRALRYVYVCVMCGYSHSLSESTKNMLRIKFLTDYTIS